MITKAGLILFGNDGRMVSLLLRLLDCTVGSGPAGRLLAILEQTGKGDHRIQEGRPSPAGSATFPSQEGLPWALTGQVPCLSWGPWGASESGGLVQSALCLGVIGGPELGALGDVRVGGSYPGSPVSGHTGRLELGALGGVRSGLVLFRDPCAWA